MNKIEHIKREIELNTGRIAIYRQLVSNARTSVNVYQEIIADFKKDIEAKEELIRMIENDM